jgi:hypothetical protein
MHLEVLCVRVHSAPGHQHPPTPTRPAVDYIDYDATTGRFHLPPEHAAALCAVAGAYQETEL